jgi:hypothetical protein
MGIGMYYQVVVANPARRSVTSEDRMTWLRAAQMRWWFAAALVVAVVIVLMVVLAGRGSATGPGNQCQLPVKDRVGGWFCSGDQSR